MKTEIKKPDAALVDVANALRDVSIECSIKELEDVIRAGHLLFEDLRAANRCNPLQISALAHRLDRAEEILQRKRRIEAQPKRNV
ncbi:MAG: hypothetical protein A3A26_01965 [Candidatus Zambryskibacteria bacterium RIFCSPLOWO2_01_FULL_47_14]|uniref:Uncharacterized protein n=1 Tax=Candidatus Zambryskibacteria bacterium RIFCSPLOWO2_01_FULL_47_14 TaxID=1802763 RepID=A0A1G2U8K0_9BACT|nr:MAG: hypothetical protein A3A26_01965 [Candidatus Zambryskibacteria bacterium RIFCSPLOWO2_01_FULL_47_14]